MHQEKNRQRSLPCLRRAGAFTEHVKRDLALLGPILLTPDLSGRLCAGQSANQAGAGNHRATRKRLVADGHIAKKIITATTGEQAILNETWHIFQNYVFRGESP